MFFCCTSLPLGSTRWVQLTLSSLCQLFYAVPSINISKSREKFLGTPRNKPLCFAAPWCRPHISPTVWHSSFCFTNKFSSLGPVQHFDPWLLGSSWCFWHRSEYHCCLEDNEPCHSWALPLMVAHYAGIILDIGSPSNATYKSIEQKVQKRPSTFQLGIYHNDFWSGIDCQLVYLIKFKNSFY